MSGIEIHTRIHTETLAANIEKIIEQKLEKGLSDEVKYQSAKLLMEYSNDLVPMESGSLRESAHVVPYGGTYAVEYDVPHAKPQYYGSNGKAKSSDFWDRTTPGTFSHWNRHIKPSDKRALYEEVAKLVKEGMNNG